MEVLLDKKQQIPTAEERVVDMYERRYNDVTTLAAEMLDGSMRSTFEYRYDGNELYASDGSSIGEIFETAERDAHKIAKEDPRLACEVRRRGEDCELGEYRDMLKMASGEGPNTMIVVSDAPAELDEWGEDVGGYNFQRKQTMLRVITRSEGKMSVTSQTLDKSDRDGLENIYGFFGIKPQPGELLSQRIYAEIDEDRQDLLVDELSREYDRKLEEKTGIKHYAGRTPADVDNTYDFVKDQNDLVDEFMNNADDDKLLGFIAALENRWNYRKAESGDDRAAYTLFGGDKGTSLFDAHDEILMAQNWAKQQGKTYSGCGMTLSAEGELDELGYGNKVEKQEWYGAYKKRGECVNCHEGPKDVGEKSWCKDCISGHCGTK